MLGLCTFNSLDLPSLVCSNIKDSRSLPRAKGSGLCQIDPIHLHLPPPLLHHCRNRLCFFPFYSLVLLFDPRRQLLCIIINIFFFDLNDLHTLHSSHFTPHSLCSLSKPLLGLSHPSSTLASISIRSRPTGRTYNTSSHKHLHQPWQTPLAPSSRGRWTLSRSRICSPCPPKTSPRWP